MAAPPTLRSRSSTSTFSLLRPWRSPPLARYAAVVRPVCPPPMTMASYEATMSHPREARRHYAQKLNAHSTLGPSIWPSWVRQAHHEDFIFSWDDKRTLSAAIAAERDGNACASWKY